MSAHAGNPMAHTLILSGSLTPKALADCLEWEPGPLVVVEFDTLLERRLYPRVEHWANSTDFFGPQDLDEFMATSRSVLVSYLTEGRQCGEPPEDLMLRRAARLEGLSDVVLTRAMHESLVDCLLERFSIRRVVAGAGCGVNFPFWREFAAARGLELRLLPAEWKSRTLSRRWERWNWRLRGAIKAWGERGRALPSATQGSGPRVLCCSSRVLRLLHSNDVEPQVLGRGLQLVGEPELGEPDAGLFQREQQRFALWWKRWQAAVLDDPQSKAPVPEPFREALRAAAARAVVEVYPRWSALRHKAREWLRATGPEMLVTDTQLGSRELVWQLAAADLGIPVAAYSYDKVLDAAVMMSPDYYLVDGMRAIPRTLAGGYPAERMIEVQTHRRPQAVRPSLRDRQRLLSGPRPRVIFADPMTVLADPQVSLRCFQSVVEASRRLSGVDFFIKFHPLRARKTEQRSFLGMDESEVDAKRREVLRLRPPGNLHFLPPEMGMDRCLDQATVLLNTTSMSGHEAFHLGVPVVFLCRHEADSITFPQLQSWLEPLFADNGETLATILQRLLSDSAMREEHIRAQQRYLDEFYWKPAPSLQQAIGLALQRAGGRPNNPHEQPC
jgi:hypothetical protein